MRLATTRCMSTADPNDQDNTKFMNLNDFVEEGYLQEVNRQFFHPLGMALTVFVEEDGAITGLGGIVDARDDDEGIYYDDTAINAEWARAVAKLAKEKHATRKATLGFVVQKAPK